MNIHTIQFNIGDFLSGVMQMDAAEIGAYTMLIMAHYQEGLDGIEDDDIIMRKVTRTNPKVWKRIKKNVLKKFYLENGYWKHHRVVSEVMKMLSKSSGGRPRKDDVGVPKQSVAKPLLESQVENKPLKSKETKKPNTIPSNTINNKNKKLPKNKHEFEEFWKLCPRKVGKGKAREKYWLARNEIKHDAMQTAIRQHAYEVKKGEVETEFIPHPATWLHQERYFDEGAMPDAEPMTEWPKWKHALATTIGEHSVKAWFSGVIPDGSVMWVPKKFQRDRIERDYSSGITQALGKQYTIKLLVERAA